MAAESLETQLEIGRRVHIVSEEDCERLIADAQEEGRMVDGLVRSLERAPTNPRGQTND